MIIDGYFLNDEENICVKSMANFIVNCQTLSPFLTKQKQTPRICLKVLGEGKDATQIKSVIITIIIIDF